MKSLEDLAYERCEELRERWFRFFEVHGLFSDPLTDPEIQRIVNTLARILNLGRVEDVFVDAEGCQLRGEKATLIVSLFPERYLYLERDDIEVVNSVRKWLWHSG